MADEATTMKWLGKKCGKKSNRAVVLIKPGVASLEAQRLKHLLAMWETGFNPWVGKIPWRRKWQPTPVFLLGESNGRRSLVSYSPRGRKESVGHD